MLRLILYIVLNKNTGFRYFLSRIINFLNINRLIIISFIVGEKILIFPKNKM